MKIVRGALLGLLIVTSMVALGALAWIFIARIGYPYDLEWMEGGELCHALRIARHAPLYAPPSVDFIPYLYTPLYPALLAALAPVGYLVGRLVSLAGFLLALGCAFVFVLRETRSRVAAIATIALVAAAYVPTGSWYELARPDSLFLGLVAAAFVCGWYGRDSHLRVALSALLMVAAFLTKQTAAPLMVALGVVFLVVDWKRALTYGGALALLGLPALYYLNQSSGGWFWTYVFTLHQKHGFYAERAFVTTPMVLILIVGPGLILIPWAAVVARGDERKALAFAMWFGATCAAVACVGFGTQWAHINAFVPGVFGLALAVGTAAGIVLPHRGGWLAPSLFIASIALAPGEGEVLAWRHVPLLWTSPPQTGYDIARLIPTARDRERNRALVDRLTRAPGEVLVPFHPFYAELAGKRTFLHRMGVLDVERAGLRTPLGLTEAIAQQRFSLAVFDNKIDGNWDMWPGLLAHYTIVERIDGGHMYAGAETEPRYLLTPKKTAQISP